MDMQLRGVIQNTGERRRFDAEDMPPAVGHRHVHTLNQQPWQRTI